MNTRSNTVSAMTLFLSTSIFLLSCSGSGQEEANRDTPVPVTVAVAARSAGEHILASGQIESKETAMISTRVMGFITGIHVRPGDHVKKGQLLATINNRDILAKRAQAHAMLTEAEAALADAKKDHERFSELYEQQSASVKEFENATLHYNAVKAKTEAARQMQNEAAAMLAYTNLTAPFAGVVVQKNADTGSMASPGVPILMLERTGGYQVQASVTEADIARIKEGAKAQVTVKSTGMIIQGKVFELSPSSQFSGGQYMIKVSIPEEAEDGLYSGMYVNVAIPVTGPTPDSGKTILVPASAIVHRDQLTGLYTISQSGTALLRWVRLGKTYGDQVEVLSGLNSEEQFILESSGKLYNGAPVAVSADAVAEQK